MAIDALQTIDIIEMLENFVGKLRPDTEEIRKELDYGYNIENQSILLFEIRPDWKTPEIIRHYSFAKTTYVKSTDSWKIFWMRGNGKWYPYSPTPTVGSLKKVLEIVKNDKFHCFFG